MEQRAMDDGRRNSPATAAFHREDMGAAESHVASEVNEWVGRTVTIQRSRAELYRFWRQLDNLPRFMENVRAVEVLDDVRSRWTVRAPGGETVRWESLIVEDVPDRLIEWRTADSSTVRNSGRIEFRDAEAEGTAVTVTVDYDPAGGEAGALVARLFGAEPKIQVRRDLVRFNQLMQTGEVAVSCDGAAASRD